MQLKVHEHSVVFVFFLVVFFKLLSQSSSSSCLEATDSLSGWIYSDPLYTFNLHIMFRNLCRSMVLDSPAVVFKNMAISSSESFPFPESIFRRASNAFSMSIFPDPSCSSFRKSSIMSWALRWKNRIKKVRVKKTFFSFV